MSCAIVYDSLTGNTEKLARALSTALGEAGIDVRGAAAPIDEASALAEGADTVLFGFWTDKGSCSGKAEEYLKGLSGKRVALFGTAGFGESKAYFDRILKAVAKKLPRDATYLGGAMCQGQMGEAIRAKYEKEAAEHPLNPRWKLMLKTYEKGQGHPNAEDLEDVARTLKGMLAS